MLQMMRVWGCPLLHFSKEKLMTSCYRLQVSLQLFNERDQAFSSLKKYSITFNLIQFVANILYFRQLCVVDKSSHAVSCLLDWSNHDPASHTGRQPSACFKASTLCKCWKFMPHAWLEKWPFSWQTMCWLGNKCPNFG